MSDEYPHCLFKEGQVGDDYLIVQNQDDEAAAEGKGYWRHDKPKKEAKKPASETKAPAKRGRKPKADAK